MAVQTSANAALPTETRRTVYTRRVPEDTVLYGVVSDQLRTFFSDAESAGREVPAFVARELSRYLECGILTADRTALQARQRLGPCCRGLADLRPQRVRLTA